MSIKTSVKSKKQKFFEAEFANQLDFTPGDRLVSTYKDPITEDKWTTWSKCWDSMSARFQRRIDNLASVFDTPPPGSSKFQQEVSHA